VLLELIAGLLAPDSGRILLAGMDQRAVPIQRRDVGLVYQDHALFPHMSVRANIGYSLPRGERGFLEEAAKLVGASALLERAPATLSLGEAQRVAIARTLVRRPKVLMLDEPLASLDSRARTGVRALLRRLNGAGQTIVHVTHDYEEALALASRVGVLEEGKLSQLGTPEDVFHHPRSRFVSEFVGIRNFLRGRISGLNGAATFETSLGRFVLPRGTEGTSGCIVFSSDAVTVSPARPEGSARNLFHGNVVDLEPVPRGVELAVETSNGGRLHALITRPSQEALGIRVGSPVWLSIKSTAIRFTSDEEVA
jgi:molybdopterin-binding protein